MLMSEVRFLERVDKVMSKPPITVHKNSSVQEAARLMFNNRIGSVLVVDDEGRLVGIVTERDLVYLVATGKVDLAKEYPVWQIMTENPITASPEESVLEALVKMSEARIRHLPVVDENGKPLGMVSYRDIMNIIPKLMSAIGKRKG